MQPAQQRQRERAFDGPDVAAQADGARVPALIGRPQVVIAVTAAGRVPGIQDRAARDRLTRLGRPAMAAQPRKQRVLAGQVPGGIAGQGAVEQVLTQVVTVGLLRAAVAG